MEESFKKNLHKIEIVGAFILLLVAVASFFPHPGITGYVSIETKTQEIDLSIANSQSYIITTNQDTPFYLTSLQLSGEVIGPGIAKAYIANNNQRILIYSNVVNKGQGLDAITGMDKITGGVIGVDVEPEEDFLVLQHLENIEEELGKITQEEKLVDGTFKDICVDSCFIEMLLNKEIAYQLIFLVEQGTILNINEITYTIRTD